MIKQRKQKKEEAIRSRITDLFEAYGYEEYRMRMFEKYSLYLAHKDFLVSEKVITFTDLSGELMALRPDVTLSIVKNTKATKHNTEKVYYCENVYREDKQNSRFREISQLGLELIGRVGVVETAETVSLALGALSACAGDFVLELSHVDFVASLLGLCGFNEQTFASAKTALNAGNESGLRSICKQSELSQPLTEKICSLATCCGDLKETLPRLEKLVANDEMRGYYNDIKNLCETLSGEPHADKLRFDCSLTAEENYYSGIIMSGFVRGVPKAVLSGGRYDKLLAKLEKDAQAIGFAVYLGELAAYLNNDAEPVDVLYIYGDMPAGKVLREVRKLRGSGLSVRTEQVRPENVSYNRIIEGDKCK